MIISKTPFRVSFFGGGTDYPQWYLKYGGQVISTAINKYCYITCRYLPNFFDHKHRFVYSKIELINDFEKIQHPVIKHTLKKYWKNGLGLEIHHDGDLPARSGLGSSSSFTVGLINSLHALQNINLDNKDLYLKAIDIEQNYVKDTVGSQDQVAVSVGGLNKIIFNKNGQIQVKNIKINKEKFTNLSSSLYLLYTGISRHASKFAKKKVDNIDSKYSYFDSLSEYVEECEKILLSKSTNMDSLGELLHESWQIKKKLASSISNLKINNLYDEAINSGAIGGKLIGAGGGGFLLLYIPKKNIKNFLKKFNKFTIVPLEISKTGAQIIFNDITRLNSKNV